MFAILLLSLIILFLVINKLNNNIQEVRKIAKNKDLENDRLVIRTLNSKFEIVQNNSIHYIWNSIKKNLKENLKNRYKISTYLEWMFASSSFFILTFRVWSYWFFIYLLTKWETNIATLSMLIITIWLLDSTLSILFIRWYKSFVDWFRKVTKMKELFIDSKNR